MSLAELLVALTILSVGTAAATALLLLASRGIRDAEVGLRAALVMTEALAAGPGTEAGERVTEVGRFRWRRTPGGGLEVRYHPLGAAGEDVDPAGTSGRRSWRLEPGGDPLGGSSSSSSW